MFGSKKAARNNGSTVLLLDIESGSVATALLQLSKQHGPRLFAYHRLHASLEPLRTSDTLFKSFDKTLVESLHNAAEVAARMRVNGRQDLGAVSHIAVFLSAPWGMPDLENNQKNFAEGIVEHVHSALEKYFDGTRASYHTSADALAFSARKAGFADNTLLAALRGELIEMLLFNGTRVGAYGTVPSGARTVLRTLTSHGALSEHEARSMLALLSHNTESSFEPLVASGEHLGREFAQGASQLLAHGSPSTVLVVGERPLADWFARSIAQTESLTALFPAEATVESLKQHYFVGSLAHSPVGDPFVLAEAVYVDERTSL